MTENRWLEFVRYFEAAEAEWFYFWNRAQVARRFGFGREVVVAEQAMNEIMAEVALEELQFELERGDYTVDESEFWFGDYSPIGS